MHHKMREPGLELVLSLIDRTPLEDSDLDLLHQRVNQWIHQAAEATPVEIDVDALGRRANTRLVEVLATIDHPGDLRDRIAEYRQKAQAASAFVDSERSREDMDNAAAHHLPGLLMVRDKIGGCTNMLAVRLSIMALGFEIGRKPRLVVMPYEQDHKIFTQVLKVLQEIGGNRLNREDLQKTLGEIRNDTQREIIDSVKQALKNRAQERYALCPY